LTTVIVKKMSSNSRGHRGCQVGKGLSTERPENIVHALGMQLRAARQAAGATQAQLAERLSVTEGLISKFETGGRVPREEHFAAWMTVCGVRAPLLPALQCMWWLARTQPDTASAQMGPWFETESQAHTLRYWMPILLPGLVQVEGYARALFVAWRQDPEAIEDLTARRIARQSILDGREGPDVTIVLWEPVLQNLVGSPEVMRDQMAHLADLCDRPRVHLHILPSATGANMGMSGPISLATTPASEVLLNEGLPDPVVTAEAVQVRGASITFNNVRSDALPRAESRMVIVEAMEGWAKECSGESPVTARVLPTVTALNLASPVTRS